MKYPQLVSTRAVNAISDWLVSRLEQLGVEAPQIYTRLLLSLLQSSVQINDPIEFSQLEAFYVNRKGSNRRYMPFDTDTLKKLNAVQCLREIVSSEQEIETIENLVEELCEKLKYIERQTAAIENDDRQFFVATPLTLSPRQNQSNSSGHQINVKLLRPLSQEKVVKQHQQHLQQQQQRSSYKDSLKALATDITDTETDPKKRYFSAFPALTKEMEDSFRIWRRNSLTWPVDRNRASNSTSSSSSTSSIISNSFGAVGIPKDEETNPGVDCVDAKVEAFSNLNVATTRNVQKICNNSWPESVNNFDDEHAMSATAGGVKRKSKRRRNQVSKEKSLQNARKSSVGYFVSSAGGGRPHRNSSPAYWDTDFVGCWEMGRDLIKEFIVKQNSKNRNRSTSESAAYTKRSDDDAVEQNMNDDDNDYDDIEDENDTNDAVCNSELLQQQKQTQQQKQFVLLAPKKVSKLTFSTPPLVPVVDISFCYDDVDDDDWDDTLASISELTADASLNTNVPPPPLRLYQREVSFGSHELVFAAGEEEMMIPPINNEAELDFEQFKAKFNSNLEALWNDVADQPRAASVKGTEVFTTSFDGSIPAVAVPFRENLKSFWTNYYNHHFDLATIPQKLHQPNAAVAAATNENDEGAGLKMDECSVSLSYSGSGADLANTSDYYSMPSNLDDFDKSVGGLRRDCSGVAETLDGRSTPIGLFFQNSIWSEHSNSGVPDTDESFYFKVWNSAQKLHQFDVVHNCGKINPSGEMDKANPDESLHFPTYNISKWSEGINAGPNLQQQQVRTHIASAASSSKSNNSNNYHNISTDCTADSSNTASVSTTSCSSAYTQSSGVCVGAVACSWQTPVVAQSLQPDLNSWSASNPMSLTEMYGDTVENGKRNINSCIFQLAPTPVGDTVTLPNHSKATSVFVEYARIKPTLNTLVRYQEPKTTNNAPRAYGLRVKDACVEDDNLLTSESTHFNPIKTYADGHTFDICSALDSIEYERSASGSLYLETERYLEYTRNDSFIAAEEDAVTAHAVSAAPLYAASNCSSLTYTCGRQKKSANEFVIKFRMRSSDIGCQTEIATNTNHAFVVQSSQQQQQQQQQHPLCLIFSGATQNLKLQATGLACNDAIEALNKAVAAAAKAAAHLPTDSHWLPMAPVRDRGVQNSFCHSSIWSSHVLNRLNVEDNCCDEVEFIHADESTEWSMQEIGKKCQLKGHNDKNQFNIANSDVHSLWGMCDECNNEFISVPADRSLRDELQLDADEIMSDLQYMQDLYICRGADELTSESDWEGTGGSDDDEDGNGHVAAKFAGRNDIDIRLDIEMQPNVVLQKVNRLIADLLQPKSNAAANEWHLDLTAVNDEKQFSGSLWYDNNDFNIWQQSEKDGLNINGTCTLRSRELLRHFNVEAQVKSNDQAQAATDDKYFLPSWEHDNLAKLWQKETPTPTLQLRLLPAKDVEKCEEVADKNLRNLQVTSVTDTADICADVAAQSSTSSNISDVTVVTIGKQVNLQSNVVTSAAAATTAAYKRVQQLICASNSTPKLKHANRKRRHSASQNYFYQSLANNNNNNNKINNNNLEIADLNDMNWKLMPIVTSAKVFTDNSGGGDGDIDMETLIKSSLQLQHDDLVKKKSNNNDNNDDDAITFKSAQPSLPSQTIITCRYWTNIEHSPTAMRTSGDGVEQQLDDGTTALSCLLNKKNASILKHVTDMVTRPLTR